MIIDPNAPAAPGSYVPFPREDDDSLLVQQGESIRGTGITIRAEIASRIMAGFAANPQSWQADNALRRANLAVEEADALIARLNNE